MREGCSSLVSGGGCPEVFDLIEEAFDEAAVALLAVRRALLQLPISTTGIGREPPPVLGTMLLVAIMAIGEMRWICPNVIPQS